MIPTAMQVARLPADPNRAALHHNLLRARRVAGLVYGREPISRDELVAMVATQFDLTHGAAAAAVERALAAGHVVAWISLPVASDDVPDPDALLAMLEAESEALTQTRRGPEPEAA